MNYRPLRVAGLIQEELALMIEREVDLEPGTLVTVTGVEVDKKLEHARVMVSVVPHANTETMLERLKQAQGTLQHLLLKKLNIKPLPRIAFYADLGAENADRVEKLFIESEDKEDSAG